MGGALCIAHPCGGRGADSRDEETPMKRKAWLRVVVFGVAVMAAVAAPAVADLPPSGAHASPAGRADARAARSASRPRSIGSSRIRAVLAALKQVETTGAALH